MFKTIIIFLVGFICGFALYLFVFRPKDENLAFNNGYRSGLVEAQFDMARKIPSVLGNDLHRADLLHADMPGAVVTNVFLQVKDATILVVERNGVKTLRDYDRNPED